MDVFGKLNDFLSKGDDSFNYDLTESPDMDDLNKKENKSNVQASQESLNDSETLSNSQKLRRSKRGRNTDSQNSSQEEVLDLTSPLLDIPNSRYNKSRRKLADTIPCMEEIDLSDFPINANTSSRGRGKNARAPRKISYKKALKLANAPLPSLATDASQTISIIPTTSNQLTAQRSTGRRADDFAVDLTGDIEISSMHNQNPLFQKVNVPKVKNNVKYEARYSLDFEEDLDQICLNIKVNGDIRKYRIRPEQHFYELFKMIGEDEDVPICNVVCFIGDKRIYPEDTPDKIGHRVSHIYTCRLIDPISSVKVNKKDMIEIKFQSDKWKKPISLTVSKFEPFSLHIQKLCQEVQFKPEQVSIKFDGDDINVTKSPIELDFEGGEIVDCRIKA